MSAAKPSAPLVGEERAVQGRVPLGKNDGIRKNFLFLPYVLPGFEYISLVYFLKLITGVTQHKLNPCNY